MPKEKVPAFQFYPKDFLTDEKVVLMSNTEVGIYIRLLCFCWLEGTLPLETESLARMARMQLKQFAKLWEHSVVKTCFRMEGGRLHHGRLDEEREKQEQFRRRQSDLGKLGGRPKKGSLSENKGSVLSGFSESKGFESSPSPSAICNLQTAVGSGSKRPVYQSDRFVVFEWQLDELSRTLGPHVFDFDLHAFFDDLSQQSRANGLVIPSDREARWKWLQAQVEAEARRRGLPMADVLAVGEDAMWAAAARKGPSVRP